MSDVRKQTRAENAARDAKEHRRITARMVAGGVLGALLVVFAVLNLQTARIHWIVTTTSSPMIVVIVVCGLIGAAITWLFAWRRRRRE